MGGRCWGFEERKQKHTECEREAKVLPSRRAFADFPGGTVVKNPPANAATRV